MDATSDLDERDHLCFHDHDSQPRFYPDAHDGEDPQLRARHICRIRRLCDLDARESLTRIPLLRLSSSFLGGRGTRYDSLQHRRGDAEEDGRGDDRLDDSYDRYSNIPVSRSPHIRLLEPRDLGTYVLWFPTKNERHTNIRIPRDIRNIRLDGRRNRHRSTLDADKDKDRNCHEGYS